MPYVHAPLRRGVGLLTAIVVTATVAVMAAPPAQAAPDPRLVRKVNSVMADSRVQRAKSSAVVLNAVTGERLHSRNGVVARIPASNTKILTAAAALETLGPDFTFHTDVYRRNPVVRGVLDGRLYLKGFGDPSTREGDYALLARRVKAAGINRVTGRLVVDPTYFDSVRYNPGWSKAYAQDYYAGEPDERHPSSPDERHPGGQQRPRQDRHADRRHRPQRLRHRGQRPEIRLRHAEQLHRFLAPAGGEHLRRHPGRLALTGRLGLRSCGSLPE